MKKLILVTIVSLFVSNLWARCNVYIPVTSFDHSGYSLTFNFDKLLLSKGYTQVDRAEEADFALFIEGVETEGRFHKAVTKMIMGSYEGSHSITCLTQYCGISDFARSFNKSFKKLDKKIKKCE